MFPTQINGFVLEKRSPRFRPRGGGVPSSMKKRSGRAQSTLVNQQRWLSPCGVFSRPSFQVDTGKVQGAGLRGRALPDLGAYGLHLASPGSRRHPAAPGRHVAFEIRDAFLLPRGGPFHRFLLPRKSPGSGELVGRELNGGKARKQPEYFRSNSNCRPLVSRCR